MQDMSSVIVPKSDQINADDLIAGPRTVTIAEVIIRGGQEQPVSIVLEGTDKVFRPCKSMSRVLVAGWGPDAKQYVGRSLTLFRDEKVKWAGMEVGGIRISHMSHIDKPMVLALTATKGSRKPFEVRPLVAEVKTITPGNDDGPEQWVERYLAKVAACPSTETLIALQEKTFATINRLKEDSPELHKRAVDAGAARAAELASPPDAVPATFDEPEV